MRVAIADPPYPGNSARHYRHHPDYAGEVDHAQLIARLDREFDGWALWTSAAALQEVLPLCPEPEWSRAKTNAWPQRRQGTGVRVCSWVKPMTPLKPNVSVQYGWEPVIVKVPRLRPAKSRHVNDWIACSPVRWKEIAGGVVGMKPPAVSYWLFDVLGLEPADELVDPFPGSGAITEAWEAWRARPRFEWMGPLENEPFPGIECAS